MTAALKPDPKPGIVTSVMDKVEAFRAWRRHESLPPFECLDTEPRRAPDRYIEMAERILKVGWKCGSTLVSPLSPPLDWNGVPRSVSFHLHSWDPHAILLMAYSLSERREFLDTAFATAVDWIDKFENASPSSDPNDFAWYDMAVGLRVYRLGFLLDAGARLSNVSDETVDSLLRTFRRHLDVLSHNDFLTKHTNHGFYQALGQLAATWRYRSDPPISASYRQAVARTHQMLRQQFFDEGTHKEHSPGYHLATLATLKNVCGSGIVEDQTTAELIARIERAFAWFILPNGNIAAVGDTDPWTLSPDQNPAERFEDPRVRWALSEGGLGEPIPHGMKLFDEAGWFAVRKADTPGQPVRNDSYLLQCAGFHSRTHKHADHGTFIWYDRGQELLVDAGRYLYSEKTKPGSEAYKQGYWYSDPRRMYVESTRAHNCVEIDGQDYQRRGAKPFGSAFTSTGKTDGLFWSESEFRHFRFVRHIRRLFFSPGHFLIIFDGLSDTTKADHSFDQWFHFAPEFEVAESAADGFRMIHSITGSATTALPLLAGTAIGAKEHGAEDPCLQGWFSNAAGSLVPNWAIAMHAEGPAVTFATLLCLADNPAANLARSRVNASGSKGQLLWSDDRGKHALSFERQLLGTLAVKVSKQS